MTYPIASTITMLSWGLLEFPIGYQRTNQTQTALNLIQHGADYLMKCAATSGQLVVQVRLSVCLLPSSGVCVCCGQACTCTDS